MRTPDDFLEHLRTLYMERGTALYGGEAITQMEHALQSAWLAERSGATAYLVSAALLHDVGHLIHAAEEIPAVGVDDDHESSGASLLAGWMDRRVVEPVRLHVAAKRYLCGTDRGYWNILSLASRQSLIQQGGPFTAEQVKEFEALGHAEDAVKLRRWDESAKVDGAETPPFDHYLQFLQASLDTPR